MVEFPALMYRCPGAYGRPGGTYSCLGVKSEDEAIQAIEDGWYETLPEAIDAHDKPVSIAEVAPVIEATEPTRAELEEKARELGIKFDGRTTNRKLTEAIRGLD